MSSSSVASESVEHPPEVDLHCHILPHWDDGPRTLEDSLSLAGKSAGLGIKKILVTPHVGRSFGGRVEPPSQNIASAIALLQEQIDLADIAIELVQGAELTLGSVEFIKRVDEEPWLAFGSKRRYVLVESPFRFWPAWAEQILFELSSRGITPIIAHPERLSDVQQDVEIMRGIVERGALLQITARSLITSQRSVKKCCQSLLQAGLVSIVASDAHSSRHPMSREVESEIVALVGDKAARQILVETPRDILAGDEPAAPPTPHPPRKSGLARFFGWG